MVEAPTRDLPGGSRICYSAFLPSRALNSLSVPGKVGCILHVAVLLKLPCAVFWRKFSVGCMIMSYDLGHLSL